ncbi:hypothetical protein SPRG_04467 [Saprolegnia parasitica CBS 223.65]|uniref:Uncharacterized protein n=1 Tax=Saprolegnia parasitica (strain CBS 223.65) TaxID=695850 RepID=A0A067CVL6_SAPPC|nr:hypothetical protein SPRG_04467 [Saprolegnia parasitica CBS 223.65]KDO30566.1 hypothetical protein SPRG_04467 [Saprolegnia parasitica CBS 223.65]|eukprot:XP_012198781.1 hypothetical protein SPRG_04467 [Saprolegnia parasitica CBS 223.65]
MTAETLIADSDVKPNETYGRRDMRFVFLLNGLLPLLIYSVAVKYTSEVNAMVLHSIPPILKGLYEISSQGQADFISSLQVISTIVCIVLMEIFEDPKVILLKDSILLLCIAFGYFVAFYNDEWNLLWRIYRLLAETSVDEKHALDLKWSRPHIRRRFQRLAGLWGTILVLENSAKVALILVYPVGTMIFVLPLMGMAFGGSLTLGTYCYLKMKDREDSLRAETMPLV